VVRERPSLKVDVSAPAIESAAKSELLEGGRGGLVAMSVGTASG